jgi:hypothetical protein
MTTPSGIATRKNACANRWTATAGRHRRGRFRRRHRRTARALRHRPAKGGAPRAWSTRTSCEAIASLTGGEDISHLHDGQAKFAVPIRLALSDADKADANALLTLETDGSARRQTGCAGRTW